MMQLPAYVRHTFLTNKDLQRTLLFFPLGFTFLELLVTIVIVGILSGIAYPLYTGYIEKAKIAVSCADIQNISSAMKENYNQNQTYPNSLNQVGYGGLLDPWGNPYQYLNIQTAKGKGQMRKNKFLVPINSDFDLYSMGKDGQSASAITAKISRDDIIRASNGAFCGLASDL
jgi:general secretion pathway protein G